MSSYREVLGYAALGVAAVVVGLATLTAVPAGHASLRITVFGLLVVIAPLVILGIGMTRRSKGYLLGSLAAVPFLLAASQAVLWLQVARIGAFNERDFLAPQHPHSSLLIQNTRHAAAPNDDSCNDACRQILMTTSYDVVIESGDGRSWMRFAIGHGADCLRSANVRQYAYLLGHRYLDICPVRADTAKPDDALVIVEDFDTDMLAPRRRPLHSNTMELYERVAGQDVSLGRWSSVAGMQAALFDPLAISRTGDLAPFGRWDVYSRILDRTIAEYLPTGAATTKDVLAALRPLLDDPEAASAAMSAFDALARSGRDKDLLWAFVAGRAGELKASPGPDPEQIEWCERWLEQLS